MRRAAQLPVASRRKATWRASRAVRRIELQALVDSIVAAGGEAHGFGCDARKEDEVVALIADIESRIGDIEVFVFNIGANVPCSVLEETARKYFKIWEMACYAGFLNGQAVAQRMAQRRRGTIIFTGATASLRGAASFAAFAGAKHALRALAQSMARELGPLNVHVAHVIIDGAIDTAFIRDNFPERVRAQERRRHPGAGPHRRRVLVPAQPAARRLDVRARPAALVGALVGGRFRPASISGVSASPSCALAPPSPRPPSSAPS